MSHVQSDRAVPGEIDVLMIEDDVEYRRLVAHWLRASEAPRFRLRFATRLDEAWHRIERADLIVLDLGLPDAAGMETLVAARELAGTIPIVVLTATENASLRQRALLAGADAFLVKRGADPHALRRTLCGAVAAGPRPLPPAAPAPSPAHTDPCTADFWIDARHASLLPRASC